MPKNIVVLLSGRGSNLEAIARACEAERWPARIAAVIANRPDAAGLEIAGRLGLRTAVVDHRTHDSRAAFDDTLAGVVESFEPDLLALAGFMRVLGTPFVQRYAGRMVNVHPSLLPAFPGLQTHQRAIEAGCHVAGASVHFVTAELDHGPIVAQVVVPVRPGDDAQRLAARVLEQEHVIYPRALRWIVEERIRIEGQRVIQLDGEPQWLMAEGG